PGRSPPPALIPTPTRDPPAPTAPQRGAGFFVPRPARLPDPSPKPPRPGVRTPSDAPAPHHRRRGRSAGRYTPARSLAMAKAVADPEDIRRFAQLLKRFSVGLSQQMAQVNAQ